MSGRAVLGEETLRVTAPGCELTVSAGGLQGVALELDYAFTNLDRRTAFLCNGLHRGWDGELHAYCRDPGLAWVALEGGCAVVRKRVLEVPPGRSTELSLPLLTRVPAAGRFEDSFCLPLPLEPRSPYDPPGPRRAVPVEVGVVFELGLCFASGEGERCAEEVPTDAGPGLRFPSLDVATQLVLRVGPFALRVTLA